MNLENNLRVAFVGNHVPRQCGIATFTADISRAVAERGADIQVVAMNDRVEGYDYPDVVRHQIDQHRLDSYREAATYLNGQYVDVVSVQHEYGIFGGEDGSYLLHLLRELNAPIVTTLHTVLQKPSLSQREVLRELSQLSERLIVMTQRGKDMLEEVHGIDPSKVRVVHHGIPTLPKAKPDSFCAQLGLPNKRIILTFGLISPDKGIEHMIAAMPNIVANHPEAYYLIVGATHPNVRASCGESYRTSLINLANELNVHGSVGFIDRFVTNDELSTYLQATSIYVTPYLKKEQITSGTLAYAFGSGNAVVSTPYWHAEELLDDGRGILVPFSDPFALSHEINDLLSDPCHLDEIQTRAYEAGRLMAWPVVGDEYVQVFGEAQKSSKTLFPDFTTVFAPEIEEIQIEAALSLDHLFNLIDDTGILQHANYSVPNRFEGYCTDDNARLAIVGIHLENHPGHARLAMNLQHKGLSFMHHAFNPATNRMRNFMSYDRKWYEESGSEDSHGRATWALGVLLKESSSPGIQAVARSLFENCLKIVDGFHSPRAIAFTILGLEKALASSANESHLELVKLLGERLHCFYRSNSSDQWAWFEDSLSYDNARLPQALMLAGHIIGNDVMVDDAITSLSWLVDVQTDPRGFFFPIGSDGFYRQGGVRASHDQQPVEAAATIDACFEAFELLGENFWKFEIWKAYRWFHGANTEQQSLIDDDNGGCRDGLMAGGVNRNQGAESTLAFLASILTILQMDNVAVNWEKRYLG